MSTLRGRVGLWEIRWLTAPRGASGKATAEILRDAKGELLKTPMRIEVRWNRDSQGMWLELPEGVRGFDIEGEPGEESGIVYRLSERLGSGSWSGLEFKRGTESVATGAGGKKKGTRVRAQMPGKIVRVLVSAGDAVEKDQPLLVMEAMKMENEIRAVSAGKVVEVKFSQGQAVESGADLMMIEPL